MAALALQGKSMDIPQTLTKCPMGARGYGKTVSVIPAPPTTTNYAVSVAYVGSRGYGKSVAMPIKVIYQNVPVFYWK